MPQKQIYLTTELYEASKLESNFSEIVARLYKDYLSIKKSKNELVKEADKIASEKLALIAEKDKELNKVILQVQQVQSIEDKTKEMEEIRQHKMADKISNCIANCMDLFNIEISAEEAEQYLTGNYNSLKEYLIFIEKWQ